MINHNLISLCREDILDIFEFVDLDDSRMIEFKEFLVALTVAHALDIIHVNEDDKTNSDVRRASFIGSIDVSSASIKALCNLIVSAYLLFDTKGEGFITKTGVQKIIDEAAPPGSSSNKQKGNGMMSQQRWQEMVRNIVVFLVELSCLTLMDFCVSGLGCKW